MSESLDGTNSCPKCGAALPSDATAGLCPRCLMAEAMMGTQDEAVGPHGTKVIPTQRSLTPAELAPHFPQLEVLECLGRGGMGVVYKARQKTLNRFVALKLLAPERVADAKFAQRFTHEAQALAALNHPGIVTIYDFGQAGGFYFLLMEFVDGVNLRQAMKAGRFTPEQALAIVPPVCEALQYAHEHGIVHRDIKPENLLLDKDGRVKIADFGIAKMLDADGARLWSETQPQQGAAAAAGAAPTAALRNEPTLASAAGTPQYMAPEQKMHRRTDHRADIYSLGVVLYELLTGELPADKLQPPSRKVQVDVRLDEIVLRALEKTPELRFQTAGEFRTQVETMAATPPPRQASSPTPPAGVPWQSPTLGWGYLVGIFFGITFTSPLAFKLANLSALGFLGFLGFVGLSGVDELRWCRGFFGFSGFFGLTGVAFIVEMAHRRKASTRVPTEVTGSDPKPAQESRWQGWDVWVIGLSLVVFGALWLLRLTDEQVLHRPLYVGAGGGLNIVLPIGLATTILLAGAAFLYMLARNIKTPGSHVASGKRILGRTIVPTLAVVVLLRTFLLQSFQVATNAATPEIPRGSLVLVWKPTRTFEAGELIAYVANGRVNLGRIDKPSREAVFVKRNDSEPTSVLHSDIVGKVMSVLWRGSAPSGVTQFDIAPVGVSNNVVILDVTTEVGQGHAELRAVLDGPESPATNMVPLFAGTLVKPAQDTANHPFRILWPGRQMWRLAFVLPDAALAKEAFEDIRPIGALPAVGDRTMAGTLFEVRDANGREVRASLQVALPFTSIDSNSVSVFGHCQHTESVVTLTWQVLASGAGLAQFSRVGSPILALRHDPQTMLHGVTVRLELIQAGANRVQFVWHIGGDPIREELEGNFRELADELLRTASFGAKATSGTRIELCRFQGKPFTVQVDVPVSTVTTSVPVRTVFWSVLFYGLIALLVIAGLVLFVVLVRKAGSTVKVVLLIASVPVVFLIASLALYSAAQARRATHAEPRAMAAAKAEMEARAGLPRTKTPAIQPAQGEPELDAESSDSTPDKPLSVALPNGVTVRLVGLSDYPTRNKPWWLPNGLECQPLFDGSAVDIRSVQPVGERTVVCAFAITGLKSGTGSEVGFVWPEFAMWGGRQFKSGVFQPEIKAVALNVPTNASLVHLRLTLDPAERFRLEYETMSDTSVQPNPVRLPLAEVGVAFRNVALRPGFRAQPSAVLFGAQWGGAANPLAPKIADPLRAPKIPVMARDPVTLGRFITEHGGLSESAGAIWRVYTGGRSANIDAHVNAGEELLVFIGDESLGWGGSASKAAAITTIVEASSEIRLKDGSLG